MNSHINRKVQVRVPGKLAASIKKQVTMKRAGSGFNSFGKNKYSSSLAPGCLGGNTGSLNQVCGLLDNVLGTNSRKGRKCQTMYDTVEDCTEAHDIDSPQELPNYLEKNWRDWMSHR